MQKIKADICIIGAGSGGLSVAAGAAQLGRRVVLIEEGEMGGDCLNYGCVPSKALLAAATAAQNARSAARYGVDAKPEIDFAAVMRHVRETIETIAPIDSQERFEGLGVTVIRAHGKFTGPTMVEAGDKVIDAKHIIIATGGKPFVPPIQGLNDVPYFTNESLFENTERPAHLIVLGGGPIGVEMAQAHRRLGSAVTLIEGATILNRDDPEAVDVVRARLQSEGVRIVENARASSAGKTAQGLFLGLATGEKIEGSHLLVAVGRKPNIANLGLEAAGISSNERGIIVNDALQTDNPRVYAIGDVAGGPQFTHLAGDHASTIVRRVLFKTPAKKRDALIPRVTYCDPELASIGLTEKEAREQYPSVTVARWSFEENDRAIAEGRTDGFIKAFIGKGGRILGATIVGKGAGDLIALWAYAIANRQKIKSITEMIAPYPTRSEVSKRAAGAYYTPTLFAPRTRLLVRLLSIFD